MLLELRGCPGFGQDRANFLQYPGGGWYGWWWMVVDQDPNGI